jgi:hypothetical protein
VLGVLSDDAACAALQLVATADGWHATPLPSVPPVEEIPENTLVVTRDTEMGFLLGRPGDDLVALLGARVERWASSEPEQLTHIIVFPTAGGVARRQPRPLVVPASAIVLSSYAERAGRAEASLDLRMSPGELAEAIPWMPDATIEQISSGVVDSVVLSARARHMLVTEVHAGRVALHGRAELSTTVEAAVQALETTPGVVEVANHVLVDESLTDLVEQELAAKGITGIRALAEHGLISLHGEAPDAATRRKAEDTAARIPGVRGVVNRIEVRAGV